MELRNQSANLEYKGSLNQVIPPLTRQAALSQQSAEKIISENQQASGIYKGQLAEGKDNAEGVRGDYQKVKSRAEAIIAELKPLREKEILDLKEQELIVADFKEVAGIDPAYVPGTVAKRPAGKLDAYALALNTTGVKDYRDMAADSECVGLVCEGFKWRGLDPGNAYPSGKPNGDGTLKQDKEAWAKCSPLESLTGKKPL